MKEPIRVRDSRALLVIVTICLAIFVLFLILSTLSGIRKQDMETLQICIPVFGGFSVLCLLLIVNFLRRKLLLYEDHLSYTPSFGRTRTFTYSEIQYVRPRGEQYVLYSYNRKRLAVVENNMTGFSEALCLLEKKQIKILPQPRFFPSVTRRP